MLGNNADNAELRALIVARTGGTPLFIEETIRTLVESGALRMRDGGYELTREIREIRIPETVQSVIAARIDSLSPKRKTLLQIASVIGSDIPIMLLREVVDLAETRIAKIAGGTAEPRNSSTKRRTRHPFNGSSGTRWSTRSHMAA